jgi:predicted Fe-Mo cluster-binding NifX family protein
MHTKVRKIREMNVDLLILKNINKNKINKINRANIKFS